MHDSSHRQYFGTVVGFADAEESDGWKVGARVREFVVSVVALYLVGDRDGSNVGNTVGLEDNNFVGPFDGLRDGDSVGVLVGCSGAGLWVGAFVGTFVGSRVGAFEGLSVG